MSRTGPDVSDALATVEYGDRTDARTRLTFRPRGGAQELGGQ